MSRDKQLHRASRTQRVRFLRITSQWGIFGRYTAGVLIRSTVRLGKLRPGACPYGCCRYEKWLTNRPSSGAAVKRNPARPPLIHKGRKP